MSVTNRFAIIGLGRFGARLARQLALAGAEVIAVDCDAGLIDKVRDDVALAVCLDATDEGALRAQGLDKVDVAVVGIGTAFEAAALTTSTLKRIGVPRVICRATTGARAEILSRIGADDIANPEAESADRWCQRLVMPQVMEKIDLGGGHSLVQVRAPDAWTGKTLEQLDVRRKYRVNVVAIRRLLAEAKQGEGGYVISTPLPDSRIELGDLLLIVGRNDAIESLPR
ncbi:MAG TPA: TrkA family potassium uptake protein [Phycisphaerae bacterium]|nr:TrkA family potassium uptake protein [Phycisphaerae bacterium]